MAALAYELPFRNRRDRRRDRRQAANFGRSAYRPRLFADQGKQPLIVCSRVALAAPKRSKHEIPGPSLRMGLGDETRSDQHTSSTDLEDAIFNAISELMIRFRECPLEGTL